jgi:ring-1,2-phenylacetyl-CoA epoxidase subunit PaaD
MGEIHNLPTIPHEIWDVLKTVVDPEIPVLTVVDMGIVRDVKQTPDSIEVSITPTYSGCPAMDAISKDIHRALSEKGFQNVSVKQVLSPAWTTDWITDEGKEKLREYGIAPPEKSTAEKSALFGEHKAVKCPRCRSENTVMISNFGSTACKALWKCEDCKEPFDYFKCI